jgi:hypothetical protein
MPQNQTGLARRRPAILALDDLDIGAADPNSDSLHEYRTVARVGLRDVL